ncbi:SulP family inorganic anion transporter [Planotetraspora kaengkrachanensis]|nr:SulP family inorganic anion transporter [Planotetraspora kaengkrachanensis]
MPASLVVFLVAVPLSMGIAVASGAPIAAGLVAAVVGGVVAGALGGSVVQVSGPAAGLSLVVAQLVHTYGWRATCMITLLAGLLQLLLGAFRVAKAALGVSPAVVHGMLAGVGVVIALSQLHIVLGGQSQTSAFENIIELPSQIVNNHSHAVLVGLLTIGVLLVWSRVPRLSVVPAPLAALVIAALTAAVLGWDLTRVDLSGGFSSLESPILPQGDWHAIAGAVMLVALLAGVESLLTCVASNRQHDGPRADLDRELAAQGVANVVSGALGGLPVSGVVVRTTANARAGARSRWSTVLHGVWVLLFTAGFAWMIALIPLEALAALLLFIGVQMVNLGHVRNLRSHREMPIYFVTMGGVVVVGLAEGVALGLGLAALLALRRLAWISVVARQAGDRWRVVVTGSLTFLGVPRLAEALAKIPPGSAVELDLNLDFMDHAGFETLHAWRQEHERGGGTIDIDEMHGEWYAAAVSGARMLPARTPPKHERFWLPWAYRRHVVDPVRQADSPCAYDEVCENGPDGEHAADGAQAVPDLLQGTREFHRRTAPLVRPLLHRMAGGQTPSHLFITCADSRIVPNIITASGPGDLFTVRNIGNLVPRGSSGSSGPPDDSVCAAIEYALKVLQVRTITVCGHSGCGAMSALMSEAPELPALRSWLKHGHRSLARFAAFPGEDDDAGPLDRLCRVNVIQQLDNLETHPLVNELVRAGNLELTGLYFDIAAARVHVLDREHFSAVPELRRG